MFKLHWEYSKVWTCKVGTRTFLNKPILFYWKPPSKILISWVLDSWWITLAIVASFFFWFFLFNNVFKCFAFGNVEPTNRAVTCEPFRSLGLTLLWHWSNQQIIYRAANWLACIFIDWLTDVLQSGHLTHDIFLINLVSNEVEAL